MHPRDMDNAGKAYRGRGMVGNDRVTTPPAGSTRMEQGHTRTGDNHRASSLEAYRRVAEGNTLEAYPKACHDACQVARKGCRLDNAQVSNLNANTNARRSQLSSFGRTGRSRSDWVRTSCVPDCLQTLLQSEGLFIEPAILLSYRAF
jgi:hypothetical protein